MRQAKPETLRSIDWGRDFLRREESKVDACAGFVPSLRVVSPMRGIAGNKNSIPKLVFGAPEHILRNGVSINPALGDCRKQFLLSGRQEFQACHGSMLISEWEPERENFFVRIVKLIVLVKLKTLFGFSNIPVREIEFPDMAKSGGRTKAFKAEIVPDDFSKTCFVQGGKDVVRHTPAIHISHEHRVKNLRVASLQTAMNRFFAVRPAKVQREPDVEIRWSANGSKRLIYPDAVALYSFVKLTKSLGREKSRNERAAEVIKATGNVLPFQPRSAERRFRWSEVRISHESRLAKRAAGPRSTALQRCPAPFRVAAVDDRPPPFVGKESLHPQRRIQKVHFHGAADGNHMPCLS